MDCAAEFRSVFELDDLFNTSISADSINGESNSEQSTSSTTDTNSENVVDSIDSHEDP